MERTVIREQMNRAGTQALPQLIFFFLQRLTKKKIARKPAEAEPQSQGKSSSDLASGLFLLTPAERLN